MSQKSKGGGGNRGADKRARFLAEYLGPCKMNATKAAIAAGYSKASARVHGSRLLTRADIKAEIAAAKARAMKAADVSQERILLELARISYFDPRKLYDKDGNRKPIHELDDDTAAAITGVDEEEVDSKVLEKAGADPDDEPERTVIRRVVKKVRAASKHAALESLMSYNGMHKSSQPGEGVQALLLTIRAHDGKPLR